MVLSALDWLDVLASVLNAADCIRFGVKETIFSRWPGTDIVIPVTSEVQVYSPPIHMYPTCMHRVPLLPYVYRLCTTYALGPLALRARRVHQV